MRIDVLSAITDLDITKPTKTSWMFLMLVLGESP
jgi:hypothetical protein